MALGEVSSAVGSASLPSIPSWALLGPSSILSCYSTVFSLHRSALVPADFFLSLFRHSAYCSFSCQQLNSTVISLHCACRNCTARR